MDYSNDPNSGSSAAVMNGHTPEPPKPNRNKKTDRKPAIHLDPVKGSFILDEALTHLERLQVEERDAEGAEQRRVANRRWVWAMFVEELEAFHGDTGGV